MPTTLKLAELVDQMIAAAKAAFLKKWSTIKALAISSIKTLAQNIVDIERLHLSGAITAEQSKLKLSIQTNGFKTLLLSEEGLGLLAVEAALNAMLNVVKDTVNKAVGFLLI